MPIGFESYDEAGKLQIQDISTPVTLITYNTVNTTGGVSSDYPLMNSKFKIQTADTSPFAAPFCAISPLDYSCLVKLNRYAELVGDLTMYYYEYEFVSLLPVGSTVPYWIFWPKTDSPKVSGVGIEIYNSSGQVNFAHTQQPMRVMGLSDGSTANLTYTAGRRYAAIVASHMGHVSSVYSHYDPTFGNIYTMSQFVTGVRAKVGGTGGVDVKPVKVNQANVIGPIDLTFPGQVMLVDVTDYGNPAASGSSSSYSVSISPTSQTESGAATSKVFAASTASVSGATASSYTWSLTGTSGGSWSIASGQNTATATAQVTGVTTSASAYATLQCAITVSGQSGQTATSSLAFTNTTAGVTFDRPPGTYNDELQFFDINASQTVVWTYTRSGSTSQNSTVPASGSSTNFFSTTQSDSAGGGITTCGIELTASLGGSPVGTWSITIRSTGSGGFPEN
jgi:hypothetical protein